MSDPKFHKENLKLIKQLLSINDYPESFFKSSIRNHLHCCLQKNNPLLNTDEQVIEHEIDISVPKY